MSCPKPSFLSCTNAMEKWMQSILRFLIALIVCGVGVCQIYAQQPDIEITLKTSGAADGNILAQQFPPATGFYPKRVRDFFSDVWGNEYPDVSTDLGRTYFWQPPGDMPGWYPRPTLVFEIHARDKNGIIPSSRLSIVKGIINHSFVAWDAEYDVVPQYTVHDWEVYKDDPDTYPFCGIGADGSQVIMDPPGPKMSVFYSTPPVCYVRSRFTFGVIVYDTQGQINLLQTRIKFQIHVLWNNQVGYVVHDASRTFATMGAALTWSEEEINDENYP